MPRGKGPTQITESKLSMDAIKKYLEQGYMANWGQGYIWNDNLVILRKICSDDSWDYIIITKYEAISIENAEKLTIN